MLNRMFFFFLALGMLLLVSPVAAADISLSSLLDEMLDRNAITQFPSPEYTCKQASSYDRASKSPSENWFANGDASQFVRDETNDGREERVLLDQTGPGTIVRWWITSHHYPATVRVYIDGNTKPEIEANLGDLVGGEFLVKAPLSSPRSNGRNIYLPIPYAKNIKITVDKWKEQANLYYQINFRTYAEGTNVQSFSMDNFKSLNEKVEKTQKELLRAPIQTGEVQTLTLKKNGGQETIEEQVDTPHVINSFSVKVDAADLPQALRSTLVKVSFDGIETIRVPLGDFFGGGVGINPYQSWYTKVDKDGTMYSFWKMPFKKGFKATFTNLDEKQDVKVTIKNISAEPFQWTDRTMYFFADWRQDRNIKTYGGGERDGQKQDWNYITLKGKGIYVGDSLSVLNRLEAWWGEGDEKIYVDGEQFPSHFGTGTEDYYGYAWCTPIFFEAPFHAQPRAEGPANFGNTTNDRFRLLDGIPFTKDFRFDMEIWHWSSTFVDYAVVTYWYGFPETKPVHDQQDVHILAEMKSKVSYETPFHFNLPGFDLKTKPTSGRAQIQDMKSWKDGKWENDDQLWWTEMKQGGKLELVVKTEKRGTQKLVCELTKARDYGKFQFYLDGHKIGGVVDLFNPEGKVINTGPVVIGTANVPKGDHTITIENVGKDEKSVGTMFGLDKIRFE